MLWHTACWRDRKCRTSTHVRTALTDRLYPNSRDPGRASRRGVGKIRRADSMDGDIGEAAGQIWRHLRQHGAMTLRHLQQQTALSERLLLMGIGWLAREGQLCFLREHRSLKIGLKV